MMLAKVSIYSKTTATTIQGLKTHLPEQLPSGNSH